MHLRRLTVRGFKSFADKTDFEFPSALTGIVGPNGCGKSNVVDALKWVLGDQRARSLRGKEMTDVIFKGAEGRDGCHQAEVHVTLTDVNGNGDSDVTIGRRLTTDKESEYLLNGESVRLKDVRDFLMDTGLGVGAYSVMEQGRIDAVLSANPEDRRAIFEEAAGISRFKLQKRETLRKLDRTEQNLARVKDLLEERARRIRSLKVQAGRARRYQLLRNELRDLRTAVAVLEGRELRVEQATVRDRLQQLAEQLRAADADQDQAASQRSDIDAQIERRASELERLAEQVHAVQGQGEALKVEAQGLDQRADELLTDADESASRRQTLEDQHREKLLALQSARERIAQLEGQLVQFARDLESRRADVRLTQTDVRELHQQREHARQQVLEWIHRRTRARNAAHDHEAHIKSHDTRIRALTERHDNLETESEQVDQELCALESVLHERRREDERLTGEEQVVREELQRADAEEAELVQQESAMRQDLSAAEGRLQVLLDMEAHMEGLDQGPRFVLQQQPEGLKGRLLDLLDVDLEYSAALEAALGPFVQALVVETRDQADEILRFLREEDQGRALLLVASEFTTALPAAANLPTGGEPLSRFVRARPESRALLDWLLKGVYLVPALGDASLRSDLCFVTRDGSLRHGPRIEGGSNDGGGGLVVRRAKMQVLRKQVADLRVRLQELLDGKEIVNDRVQTLTNECSDLSVQLQQLRGQIQADESRHGRLADRLQDFDRELRTLRLEREDVAAQRRTASANLATQLMNVFLLGKLELREATAETEAAQKLVAAQTLAQEKVQQEQEVQLAEVQCRSERQATRDAIRMHEETLAELKRTSGSLTERESKNRDAAEQARQQAERCRARVLELAQQHEQLTGQRDEAQQHLTAAREQAAGLQEELSVLADRRAEINDSLTQGRLDQSELDHRFQRLEERLWEDVAVALRRCLGEVRGFGLVTRPPYGPRITTELRQQLALDQDFEVQGPPIPEAMLAMELGLERLWEREDFDIVESKKQAEVVKARIDRLGAVNLCAVRELDEEEERFQLMEKEVGDLTESRLQLVEALRRMETESRALFEETFHAARKNFQEIFRKLFQGGRADMFLAEHDGDALEAGIEIMARPPGKELQSINLLSGGERSMTALAILFAVFMVKPSPFCILDEVDAALDDTNVERFLRVLREFVGPTQFCVVTHHKRTMAECQMLYGVTMQRRGVSSRIAVSLDDVDDLHENGNGNGNGNAAEGEDAGESGNGDDRGTTSGGGVGSEHSRLEPALRRRIAGEEPVGF